MTPEQHIYGSYPRHVGAVAAYKSISKAVARLMAGEAGLPKHSLREAQIRLYRAAKAYAESPHGMQADKTLIPHPATWFNQGRYLDDPSEWQHVQQKMFAPQLAGKPNDSWMSTGSGYTDEEAVELRARIAASEQRTKEQRARIQ